MSFIFFNGDVFTLIEGVVIFIGVLIFEAECLNVTILVDVSHLSDEELNVLSDVRY